MPELPEVETIKRGLTKYVVGHTIQDVEIINPGIIQGDIKNVVDQKIIGARRVGKGLILDLSNNYSLGIHIKLTGQLIFRGKETDGLEVSKDKVGSVPNKFTHVVFHLTKRSATDEVRQASLYYNDQRRFGWIKIVKTTELMTLPFFKNMGPEPFAKQNGSLQPNLDLETFSKIVKGKPTKIKPLLMDQEKIGGIGNIYANDALFKAMINPARPAKSLSDDEIKELFNAIIAVMEKSFEEGGASELSFVNVLGQEGGYQRHALVYGKTGKPCPRGDGTIERITLAGRGTFFCKQCQA